MLFVFLKDLSNDTLLDTMFPFEISYSIQVYLTFRFRKTEMPPLVIQINFGNKNFFIKVRQLYSTLSRNKDRLIHTLYTVVSS